MTPAKSMDYVERFRIAPGLRTKLERVDPGYKDPEINESQAAGVLDADTKRLRELQDVLYAENARSLLVCLQGWTRPARTGRSLTSSAR